MTRPDRKTGTREWSDASVNCCLGCRHGCLYCYARFNALHRFRKIKTGDDWTNERVDADALARDRRKHQGVVMFPTAHDISSGNDLACMATLIHLLRADNRVLVVSKAGPQVPYLLDAAKQRAGRGAIELRVSVTCLSDAIARFWEPGAPSPAARLAALAQARALGFDTSVSIEPCLEVERVREIVAAVIAEPVSVNGEIWVGAANHLRKRTAWCRARTSGLEDEICRIEAGQTPGKMHDVWEALKGNPQIRWKDSYQKALGIDAEGKPRQEQV